MRPVGDKKKKVLNLELAMLVTLGTVSVPSLGHVHHLEEMLSPSSEKLVEIEMELSTLYELSIILILSNAHMDQ